MLHSIGLGCPDCGKLTPESLLAGTEGHCARCALRFRIQRAQLHPPADHERYCAACDRHIVKGQWEKHVRSHWHKLTVRAHFKEVARA